MADQPQGGAAPDAQTPVPTAAPSALATGEASGTAPTGETITMPSAALKARLDEERKRGQAAMLRDLGFESPKDIKAILDAAKAKADAELSESDRLRKALDEAKPRVDRAAKLEAQIAAIAEREFNALSPKDQAYVDAFAKGDPEERLRFIGVSREHGVLGGTAAPAATAVPTPPVTTTPGPAPRPTHTQNEWEKYDALTKSNPLMASAFYQANRAAIDATRPNPK